MEIVKEKNRVMLIEDVVIGFVSFPNICEGVVDIEHTVVNASFRGQGLASILLNAAYDIIKEQNLKAKVSCSYAIDWFSKNKDKKDILL